MLLFKNKFVIIIFFILRAFNVEHEQLKHVYFDSRL